MILKKLFTVCLLHISYFIFSQSWVKLTSGSGVTFAPNGPVYSLNTDQVNSKLYIGGDFNGATGTSFPNCIVSWDNNVLTAVGSGSYIGQRVNSVQIFNNSLYAGGTFDDMGGVPNTKWIAKKTGATWSSIGVGINQYVQTMTIYNGNLIVAGGNDAGGGPYSERIKKWDGATWSSLGTGITSAMGSVHSLCVYNGELYVGGSFTNAGGVFTFYIAKWNGTTWSALGSGMDNWVNAMAVYNGELYVGGRFTTAGGVSSNTLAKWNGTSWSSIPQVNGEIYALHVFNGELYAGGCFGISGVPGTNSIAKWDGTNWHAIGNGVMASSGCGTVYSIATYNNEIYIGGKFNFTGDGLSYLPFTAKFGYSNPIGVVEINNFEQSPLITPNPNNGKFKLEIENCCENEIIYFYNSTGDIVFFDKIHLGSNEFNLNSLPPSLYYYLIKKDNYAIMSGKFIVDY